jgi:D-aspartate ligase
VMDTLMDKAEFQAAAQNNGFPVPLAVVLQNRADLKAVCSLRFPCILKPVSKSTEYDLRFKKAYKVANAEDVNKLYTEMEDTGAMILQEWIEGGDDSIYFCLQFRGQSQIPIASFVGRKVRSWPPQVGGTASCVPAPEEAPLLESLTNRFFSEIGFYGMGSMEYKKDTITGKFVMVEPTVGRTDFQEELATLNGVNIPLAAYGYEANMQVTAITPAGQPAAWIVSQLNRWSSEARDKAPALPAGMRRYDAIGRLGDPLPWLHSMAERAKDRFFARESR